MACSPLETLVLPRGTSSLLHSWWIRVLSLVPRQCLILSLLTGRWWPSLFSAAGMNTMTKREERIHLVYTLGRSPSLREVLAGTEAENKGEMHLTGSPPLAHVPAFQVLGLKAHTITQLCPLSYAIQTHLPRVSLPTVGYASHINQQSRQFPIDVATGQYDLAALDSLFPGDSWLCQVDSENQPGQM